MHQGYIIFLVLENIEWYFKSYEFPVSLNSNSALKAYILIFDKRKENMNLRGRGKQRGNTRTMVKLTRVQKEGRGERMERGKDMAGEAMFIGNVTKSYSFPSHIYVEVHFHFFFF